MWTAGDTIAVAVPTAIALFGGIATGLRWGITAFDKRIYASETRLSGNIDSTETRLTVRLTDISADQRLQGAKIDNYGERLAWLEGRQNLPLGSTHAVPPAAAVGRDQ